MPEPDFIICPCCKALKHRSTVWRHKKKAAEAQAQAEVKAQAQAPIVQHESLPPPKWRRITHQADASPSSSGRPQLHALSFDSNLPLPFLDPPADLDLPQPPEDARTVPPRRFADNVLLDLHAWTHRNPNENNDGDPEDAPEKDVVDADSIDPGTGDFWNKEDVDVEGEVDPCEGIILLWDILTEKFIVEAEEFGKFAHSLLDTR